MPCFKGRVEDNTIIVDIFIKEDNNNAQENTELVIEKDKNIYKALIDTGATISCISKTAVDRLKLKQEGNTNVQGVNSINISPTYIVDVFIPIVERKIMSIEADKAKIDETISIKAWKSLFVLQFLHKNSNFDVILGMDILKDFSIYLHNNEYTICY